MSELTREDVHFCLTRLPKDIRDALQSRRVILAGGFIRETIAGNKINDIDLFGYSKEELRTVATELALTRKGKLHETENALTVLAAPRAPVQFITRWLVDEPSKYISTFDFTVCQVAIWWESGEWRSACHSHFYADLAARRLTYTFPTRDEEAGGSMLRVRKFLQRGYDIQVQSLSGVMARVFKKIEFERINSYDEKEIAKITHSILREVDPSLIVDGFDVPNAEVIEAA